MLCLMSMVLSVLGPVLPPGDSVTPAEAIDPVIEEPLRPLLPESGATAATPRTCGAINVLIIAAVASIAMTLPATRQTTSSVRRCVQGAG